MCATLLLAHCSSDKEFIEEKPLEPQTPETEFCEASLIGRLSKTRADVSEDGQTISWTAGDQLQVAVVKGTIVKHSTFDIAAEDLQNNLFKPTQPLQLQATETYDWYATFPNAASPIYPDGLFVLGDQTQAVDNNRAHLNATMLATGSVENVQATQTPEMQFKHHTALMKFEVESTIGVEIQGIAIKSSNAPVGGSLKVNFANHTSTIEAGTGKQEVKLTLTPAVTVAAQGTMNGYMSVAPFTLRANDLMTITLFTNKGVVAQRMRMKNEISFLAGSIYPTKVIVKGDKITSVIIGWVPNGIEGELSPEQQDIPGFTPTIELLTWTEEETF